MYKIVGFPKTRTFRIIWMLEELGLSYDISPDYPRNGEAARLNPSGKIPVLLDGDVPIIDSTASIQYLADKHGACTYAAGTLERAKQDSWTCLTLDEVDGCLWTAARNSFINPEERRVPAIKDALKWEFSRTINVIEERLGDNPYLTGDTFTVPDIILTHCGFWAKNAGFDLGDGSINDYLARVSERPAYKRADAVRSAA